MKKILYVSIIAAFLIALIMNSFLISVLIIVPLGIIISTNKKLQVGMGQFLREIDREN